MCSLLICYSKERSGTFMWYCSNSFSLWFLIHLGTLQNIHTLLVSFCDSSIVDDTEDFSNNSFAHQNNQKRGRLLARRSDPLEMPESSKWWPSCASGPAPWYCRNLGNGYKQVMADLLCPATDARDTGWVLSSWLCFAQYWVMWLWGVCATRWKMCRSNLQTDSKSFF